MNYIALINQFWVKNLEYSFTPNELAVYFHLLERSNALGWKNPFNLSVDELLVKLRLKTKDPLNTARNRLKQAGLIDFRNGDGRGRTTQYEIHDPEAPPERGGKRDKKNTPLYPTLSPPLLPTLSPSENPLLHKTKLKLNERETANAVTASACEQASDSEKNCDPCRDRTTDHLTPSQSQPTGKRGKKGRGAPPAGPSSPPPPQLADRWPALVADLDEDQRDIWDRFVAWEQDNPLPKVFAMTEPLLPRQLVALIQKHGAGPVAGVLQDMQNRPKLLTEYDSANLTAQSWLRRRQQATP